MPTLNVTQLVEATGGELLCGSPQAVVDSFFIDSRLVKSRSAFFALKGTRTDGHQYLAQAAASGAAVAVVEHAPENIEAAPPAVILVASTVSALSRSAAWVRRSSKGVKWIALTGSNGKTTTKEMIAQGLSASSRHVHRTPGNYNNQLGVPLTILALPDDADTAVMELGMSAPGEIAELARLVDPDIGLLTNVRAVHIAFFRTLDDVAAAKGELFAVLRAEATAVVNLDELHVRVQAARHEGPRVTFGRHPLADLRLEQVENRFLPGAALSLRYQGRTYHLQLRMGGAHAAYNALAALAVVVAAAQELEAAAARIECLEPSPGRGKIHRLEREMLLVDDSYNSSPPALAAVLETLRLSEPQRRKVLVMGDMLELGPMESALHREAGKRAAAAGVQLLVGVGPLSRETVESARRAGVPEVHHHPSSLRAAEALAEFLRPGDLIVVKGSHSMHMERVVEALLGHLGQLGEAAG